MLGEKIYSLRKNRKISQEEFAEILNTSRQNISKWERNESKPDVDKLIIIARLFNVSVDYLLSYKEATNTTYGFSSSDYSDSSREAKQTDYAVARYCWMWSNGKGVWWLRSPVYYDSSDYSYYARNVFYSGFLYDFVDHSFNGVRAALEIDVIK